MSVVSVKVSSKTKKEMESLRDNIEWPEEIRGFIESRLEQERRRQAVERAEKTLKGVRPVPKGTAAKLVREDRDRGH
ncbi:MAG: hypothetical protein OK457_10495 [Thaumarchaeota archaeon]|nr:hypothetical protein [Nitrososphaerota archaeon]